MIIQRYLNALYFARLKSDFAFLFRMFPDFDGELDIALRGTYFNIYYRGNSLAKVEFLADDRYRIGISKAFYNGSKASRDERFQQDVIESTSRVSLTLPKALLHPFFQKAHLDNFCANIKNENYGEEIMLEQSIITDNRERDDLVIIDRQVQDSGWKERIDLLALEQIEGQHYRFRILEVKLGNNKELASDVAHQLQKYVDHVTEHFDDYKKCYEEIYRQRKALELHDSPGYDAITIDKSVQGSVVVLGYSGLAAKALTTLRGRYPDIHICQFNHRLDMTGC